MAAFPEMVPDGQDYILGSSVWLREVGYAKESVCYATLAPTQAVLKLSFVPKIVQTGTRPLRALGIRAAGDTGDGWSFDAAIRVLTVRHAAGEVSLSQ